MEEEAEKLKEMQKQVEESIMSPTAGQPACKNFIMLIKGWFVGVQTKLVYPTRQKAVGKGCSRLSE